MDAHQCLDGFDDPLGVPDQVRINIFGAETVRKPPQKSRLMVDLAMCPWWSARYFATRG
jgi:hypothetical protein